MNQQIFAKINFAKIDFELNRLCIVDSNWIKLGNNLCEILSNKLGIS